MKKRVLSLILAFIMCFSMIMTTNVTVSYAQETVDTWEQTYSPWALDELLVGDSYGIYPMSWYQLDMTAPISSRQLRVLISGVRHKILETDEVVKNIDQIYQLSNKMTVEKVLTNFYTMLSGYEFTSDIGIKNKTAIKYMKENGVFTGTDGELALTDTCSIEQACVLSTRLITVVYDKLDAASKGFLWVTKSGDNTVYLLGSIHMASTEIYPFSSDIWSAFNSAEALAVEVNMFDMEGAYKLAEMGVYTDGTTLKDHVSAETYKQVIELASLFGYTEDIITRFKPWYIYTMFLALTSTDSAAFDEVVQAAALGIDVNFMTTALIAGKPIIEVEGYVYQAQVLDSFSDELEEFLLTDTIDSIYDILSGKITEGSDNLEAALELWHEGNVDAFKEYTSIENEYPEIYSEQATVEKALIEEFTQKLITQRDKKMADYIDGLLKTEGSHTYFVVVGSGHYISDYSVLDILKEKGYEITQIK